MKRNEKDIIEDGRAALYRIHYECVRRNLEYVQAYEKINDGPIPPDHTRASLKYQWGILYYDEVPNPNERPPLETALTRPLPQWDDSLGFFGEFRRRRGEPFENLSIENLPRGKLILEYYPEDEPYLPYCFVANMQWSEKYLKEQVVEWIKRLYRLRKHAGLIPPQSARKRGKEKFPEYIQEYRRLREGESYSFYLPAVRPTQKHRVAEYEDYLRVYDLRSAGKSDRGIGEMFWPDIDADSMKRKARRYAQKGKDLVLNPPLRPNLFTGGL